MPWSQTGATKYHAQLELLDRGWSGDGNYMDLMKFITTTKDRDLILKKRFKWTFNIFY